ncbi:MAG: hypothetical protein R3E95_20960 [Thiolinea sp.]
MPDAHNSDATLWPPSSYYQQLARLRQVIGQTLYLAEIRDTTMNAGVHFSSTGYQLLAIVDYPQPDPYRQLCPHLLILDDGRGVNLGRIARISINTAFGPNEDEVLYQNAEFMDKVLLAPRQLSRQSITATSKAIMAMALGDQPGRLLATCYATDKPGEIA